MSFEQQSALLLRLKERLSEADEFDDVVSLVDQLRRRDDLLAKVAKEIDELLRTIRKTSPDKAAAPSADRIQPKSSKTPNSQPSIPAQDSVINKLAGHKVVRYGSHTIEIKAHTFLTSEETVLYDGKEVSKKKSVFGGTHVFRVNEEGENIVYEIKIGIRWLSLALFACFEVKRNGQLIFTDR